MTFNGRVHWVNHIFWNCIFKDHTEVNIRETLESLKWRPTWMRTQVFGGREEKVTHSPQTVLRPTHMDHPFSHKNSPFSLYALLLLLPLEEAFPGKSQLRHKVKRFIGTQFVSTAKQKIVLRKTCVGAQRQSFTFLSLVPHDHLSTGKCSLGGPWALPEWMTRFLSAPGLKQYPSTKPSGAQVSLRGAPLSPEQLPMRLPTEKKRKEHFMKQVFAPQ